MSLWRRMKKWDEERNLTEFDGLTMISMLREELTEFEDAVNTYDEHEMVDALCDLIKVSAQGISNLNYRIEDSLDEMLKEIESRQQDPEQKLEWERFGSNGMKWQKDRNQDPETLYQADYERARIKCKVVIDD